MAGSGRWWLTRGLVGALFCALLACSSGGPAPEPAPQQTGPTIPTDGGVPPAVDGGTAPTDGGTAPTDGGTANACDGLHPGSVGTPVSFETADSDAYDCGPGESDGAGTVLVTRRFQAQAHTAGTWLSPEGSVLGSGTAPEDPFGTGDTFLGIVQISAEVWLEAFDDHAESIRRLPSTGPRPIVSGNDPTGGMVVVTEAGPDFGHQTLRAYDGRLLGRWAQPLPDGYVAAAVGVDRTGAVVVLAGPPGEALMALWFGADGAPGAAFSLLPAHWTGALRLDEQIGSGLFLRVGDVWSRSLAAGADHADPPPAWLASRPGTKVHMAFGGRAYAVMPDPAAAPSTPCTQRVETLAPDGTECATSDFKVSDRACTTSELRVGYDGTVIQTVPNSELRCDPSGSHCFCRFQYWPAFYGHSDR